MRAALALVAVCLPAIAFGEQPLRPLVVEDLLRMEGFGRAVFAPDGKSVVYEAMPPYVEAPAFTIGAYPYNRGPLALLVQRSLREPANARRFEFSPGERNWMGSWSPDGRRLAIYSLKDGHVGAGSLDMESGALTRFGLTPICCYPTQLPVWISNTEVLYPAVAEDRQSGAAGNLAVLAELNRRWNATAGGKEVSASVMVSSADGLADADRFLDGALMRANAVTGQVSALARGHFYSLTLSPDSRYVAALKQGGWLQPRVEAGPNDAPSFRSQLVVIDLSSPGAPAVIPCDRCNIVGRSIHWTGHRPQVTFDAYVLGSTLGDARTHAFDLRTSTLRERAQREVHDILAAANKTAPPVAEGEQPLDVSVDGRLTLFRVDSRSGSRLIVTERGRREPIEVARINGYFDDIAESETQYVRFKTHDGHDLSSCVLMPPNAVPSHRYPAVVQVYPGLSGDCWFSSLAKSDPLIFLNMQLLAAHGYAVISASTPSDLVMGAVDPPAKTTELVLAAVDAASAQGVVDSARVGLFGFSQGMREALEVIAHTDRFKAAFVGNGISDFISHYGTSTLSERMNFEDESMIGNASRYESRGSENWLGTSPWENPDAYVRASPVFAADKIHTPLLLMHSDGDVFPLGQSEEMFAALYRLRRDATYVTYWGESHGNLSPANFRDAWNRIFAWFDTYVNSEN